MTIPAALIEDIRAGNCVAFVGAGFSAPAVPTWKALLAKMALRVTNTSHQSEVLAVIESAKTPLEFEMAGQLLRDALGVEFDTAAADIIGIDPAVEKMHDRRKMLGEIPFAGVLTTNVDPFIDGLAPGPGVYRTILRPQRQWWSRSAWKAGLSKEHVIKLHGDVSDPKGNALVLARLDYRRRLYESSDYATFLRAVFATRTVLFLGVSFTDAYLNEVRSEVLSLLDPDPVRGRRPFAYAIMSDVGPLRRHYFKSREGIEVLNYETTEGGSHGGFDTVLRSIHRQTSTVARLGNALAGKSVLWLDAHANNNKLGRQVFDRAVSGAPSNVHLVEKRTAAEAISAMEKEPFDLVITHFGQIPGSAAANAVAPQFLESMRGGGHLAPVVVFASSGDAISRRRLVLRCGALDYLWTWEDLFKRVVDVLEDPPTPAAGAAPH